jgi:DNA-binding SARP family transcriptional activator
MKAQKHATRVRSLGWRLELLGGAILSDGALRHRLERKTAGVLALLALEGERSRSQVAGMLWSNTDERNARNNLRQCLHRLKKWCGSDLVQGSEHLSLTAELEVDVVTLESRAFLGDHAGLIAVHGEILEQFDFEDCPEFAEWLEVQRVRWRNARITAYRRALQHPDASEALEWAQDWVNLEPLSEEAHRALARAYAAQGNRALALQTLRALEALLKRELNAEPSAMTRDLYMALERNETVPQTASAILPSVVRQPPFLAGREQQWALLERAWAAGLDIIIRGAAGVGKTRLMLDFLASKTKFDLIAARPGDVDVPMSAFARTLRQILSVESTFKVPAWVKTELARLIPEFGSAPPIMTSEADRQRFYEALFTVSEHRFAQGIETIALDDLQFMDRASFDAALANTRRARRLGIRTVAAYRSGELAPELEAQIEQAMTLGSLQIIDLEPLEEVSLGALVQSLHLKAPRDLAHNLQQSTGGNPLYALETIRDLLERDAMHHDLEQRPLLGTQHLTAYRLERRSVEAQRIAQVAAVAGEDFTLELAAFVLDCKPLELQDGLLELEQAQIMRGERFQHDLLQEAVEVTISTSVKRFLHRKCAAYLEQHGNPARVARHWLETFEYDRAILAMLKAAEVEIGMARYKEAIELIEHAMTFPSNPDYRHRAQALLGGIHAYELRLEEAKGILEPLLEVVSDPEAHWMTLSYLCSLHMNKGSLDAARQFGQRAFKLAELLGVDSRIEDTSYKLGLIALGEGQYEQAMEYIAPVVVAERKKPINAMFLHTLTAFAHCLFELGQNQEAQMVEDELLRHARAIGADEIILFQATNELYRDYVWNGKAKEAVQKAEKVLTELKFHQSRVDTSPLRNNLADIYARFGQVDDSIRHHLKIIQGTNVRYHCPSYARLAVLYYQNAEFDFANDALARALELVRDNDYPNARFAVTYAVYTFGTDEQRTLVQPYLDTLNFDALPPGYRAELEALLDVNKNVHKSR